MKSGTKSLVALALAQCIAWGSAARAEIVFSALHEGLWRIYRSGGEGDARPVETDLAGPGGKGFLLHAESISFLHPRTKEERCVSSKSPFY